MFVVFINLPVRISSIAFFNDPGDWYTVICKLEYFLFYAVRANSCWLIALACGNRYVSSLCGDVWRRRLSSPTKTLSTILCGFQLNAGKCKPQAGIYSAFAPLWHAVLYSVLPSLCMFLFGLPTITSVRRR